MVKICFVLINCISSLRSNGFQNLISEKLTLFAYGSHIDWKTWKMRVHFPFGEKSGNFEHTGEVRKFTQNTGKVSEFYPVIFIFLPDFLI